MRFGLTDEQRGFAESLDALLRGVDTPKVARDWAGGDHAGGLDLWEQLADAGVTGLLVPESAGGLSATPVDMVIAFEQLGRHVVPGPWVESVAFLSRLVADLPGLDARDEVLAALVGGTEVLTVAAPPLTTRALDADAATRVMLVDDSGLHIATTGDRRRSVDPARRLFEVGSARGLVAVTFETRAAAIDMAVLACSAQLLGLGGRLLKESVDYAKHRTQFGQPIGEFQALKHALADVRVALDLARPLVWAAALSVGSGDGPRDVSAAKVAAGDAAYSAARVALQVHGAIGYTAEHDLSLWILKVRALQSAWGTSMWHRERILRSI